MQTNETPRPLDALLRELYRLPPLRPGDDFSAGESPSVVILEMLLNQKVGIERATAAAYAVHLALGTPAGLDRPIPQATAWPYPGQRLRPPARALANIVQAHLDADPAALGIPISGLPAAVAGSLASLERYHNRQSRFFDPVRQVRLTAAQVAALTPARVVSDTGQNYNPERLSARLTSAAALLRLLEAGAPVTRRQLTELDFVGDETADTLLVYIFGQPALIIDDYLKRLLHRHHALPQERATRAGVLRLFDGRMPRTQDEAHRLHARVNEIAVDHCKDRADCEQCPLKHLPHR